MNSPAALVGATPESTSAAVTAMGFPATPELITATAQDVGETTIISRAGGAPTLAVGMAHIFSSAIGGKAMMAFWYHFAILFEALFILTAVDAGTRAGRFMLQDLLGVFAPGLADTTSWVSNIVATALCVGAWGYFLYQGVTDPLGGVNTLWPLFGISNQMLAAVALTLWVVAAACRIRASTAATIAVCIFGSLIIEPRALPRPHVVSLLGMALCVHAIERARAVRRAAPLRWIPLLIAAWANVHVECLFGVAVVALFGFGESVRELAHLKLGIIGGRTELAHLKVGTTDHAGSSAVDG